MVDSKATDGLFTVFGQATLKGAFLMVGHAMTMIFSLKVAYSFDELILADVLPKSESFKSNGALCEVSDKTSCRKVSADIV